MTLGSLNYKAIIFARVSIIVFALSAALVGIVNAEIYRWQDEHGNWHFSDTPKNKSDQPLAIRSGQSTSVDQTSNKDDQKQTKSSGSDLKALLEEAIRPAGIVETVTLSVVGIETPMGYGSGFFISNQGLIVTNRHVIRPNTSDAVKQQEVDFRNQEARLKETGRRLDAEEKKLDDYEEELKAYKADLDKRNGGLQSKAVYADYRVLEQRYEENRADYEKVRANWKRRKKEFDRSFSDFKFKTSLAGAARQFKVVLKNDDEYRAQLVEISKDYDLALLKLKGFTTPNLVLGDSDESRQGDRVFAIGSPLGLRDSVTAGIITGVKEEYLVTDAQILPGNSGGPLVDEKGRVVGVNTAKYAQNVQAEGFCFAIPLSVLEEEFSRHLP